MGFCLIFRCFIFQGHAELLSCGPWELCTRHCLTGASERRVITVDVEAREQVARDARHGLQLVRRDVVAVDRAARLPCQPLVNTARAEGVLALWSLQKHRNCFVLTWTGWFGALVERPTDLL